MAYLTLKNIPVGALSHNLELIPGKGGQIIKSAGGAGYVQSVEANVGYHQNALR